MFNRNENYQILYMYLCIAPWWILMKLVKFCKYIYALPCENHDLIVGRHAK